MSFPERDDALNELNETLSTVRGAVLEWWELSSNGGVASLHFSNGKVVSLGVSGNLWDEAYPVFQQGRYE